jgi:hypothetical protein
VLQALSATPARRGSSRKDRSSKPETVSAQIAASTPATCAARPGPSASAGSHPNDSATVLGRFRRAHDGLTSVYHQGIPFIGGVVAGRREASRHREVC